MDFTGITYGFDQPIQHIIQGSDSLFLDRVIFSMTHTGTWVPLYVFLLLMVIKNNQTMKQIGLLLFMAIISVVFADVIIDDIVKPLCMRYRPTRDPYLMYSIDVVNNYRAGSYGFFSAHAANTMSVAVFFTLVVRNRIFGVVMILWSLLIGYTRIYLGVHYPSDVLTGWVWGLLIAVSTYFIYCYLYKKVSPERHYISTHYTETGYSLVDVYSVIQVIAATLLYSCIRAMFSI